MNDRLIQVVTVTPNPAIDRTLTIRDFIAGGVNRVEQQRSNPGGKGVNVASALADYGHAVAATGFLGSDNSAPFEALFSVKGIDDHFIRIAGETRVGIKISDPARQQTTDINFPGRSPAPGDIEMLLRRVQTLAARSGPWFVLAGSLPPGVEPTLYRDLARSLKAQGCRVLLDTSGEALRHALDGGPHIIKPNLHELEALVGARLSGNREAVEAARSLTARGVELAVISMGAEGALLITGERVILARPPEVKALSTVGAGDAMVAGIIAGQLDELPLPQTARLATAFSLDALTRPESAPASRARIDDLMNEVTVHEFGRGHSIE
ncbi:MAG TPA: 1-phosphofructokinase [Blastocatellia bacterium]|jgi:1-phosphofructokinase|nr:1-phosphofructokinase [Blastocatellia bacterium]